MVDISTIAIDPEVIKLVPRQYAVEHSLIPLSVDGDEIIIAIEGNYDESVINDLSFLLGKKIIVEIVESEIIRKTIGDIYNLHIDETQKENKFITSELPRAGESHEQYQDQNDHVTSDGSIVTLVNGMISNAIRMHASDIHIEPYEQSLRIRYRLDGVLNEIMRHGIEKIKPVVSRLKIMADLDIAEKRRPQDGRIRITESGRLIDIRVSTLPTDFGEKIVLRILDKAHVKLDLTKLGFEANDLALFEKTISLPYGMILVTGPTGSGKTTTLYAALNRINTPQINITTIEDPIEYNLAGINQTHVRSDIGVTFAAALRSILRQDPNVIMVGEIRDAETAEIAIRAALTGHLVFSTLHTNDAPSAITRLIDMGIEPFLVAASVKMILSQRLLRTLCNQCKKAAIVTQKDLDGLQAASLRPGDNIFLPVGCVACNNTGYNGRNAVYELLQVSSEISDLIARGTTTSKVLPIARLNGYRSLRERAMEKTERGETSLREVIRETAG